MDERDKLLFSVHAWVLEHPEDAPAVVNACQLGIHDAFNRASQRATDMESALAQALAPKLPKRVKEKNIREWLMKWRDRCSMKWDWYLDA